MGKIVLEKIKEYAFHTFLFTVPIFYVAGILDTRIVQERYFQAACMLVGSLFFGNLWLTLFMFLNIALFVFHGGIVGSSQVLSIFLTGILFACSRNFFSTREFSKYAKVLYTLAFLSLFMMVFQVFGVDPIQTVISSDGQIQGTQAQNRLSGLFLLTAFNGIFLALVMALMTFLVSWVGLLLVIPILFCKSSAAMLGAGVVFLFFIYYNFKRFFIPAIIVSILAGGLYLYKDSQDDSLTFKSRFENWHLFIRKSLEYPIGYGPDSFRNFNKNKNFVFVADEDYNPIIRQKLTQEKDVLMYYSANPSKKIERFKGRMPKHIGDWQEAHNEFIELFFQYGILGVLILIGLCRELYDRFVLSDKSKEVLALFVCLCVYFAVSTTQFPFHLARLAGIFGIILGAYYSKTDKYYQIKEKYNA